MIDCPKCPNFIRENVGRADDGEKHEYTFVTIKDLIEHLKIHKRPHIKAIPYGYWLGKSFGIWYPTTETRSEYYSDYQDYIKGTCSNRPCIICLYNKINYARKWSYVRKHRKGF